MMYVWFGRMEQLSLCALNSLRPNKKLTVEAEIKKKTIPLFGVFVMSTEKSIEN